MIASVRACCDQDAGLMAALMYGSFVQGEGDAYSDIEFWLFFRDGAIPEARSWIEGIAPVAACFRNEFGTFVAIFENGIRGEFHFEPLARLDIVRGWAKNYEAGGIEVVLDRTGELTEHVAYLEEHVPDRATPPRVQALCDRFTNWLLLGRNVLRRGEHARALDALTHIHRYLLWMVRVVEHQEQHHWGTPARALEQDLSPTAYARFQQCTAALDPAALERAYEETFRWGSELMQTLVDTYDVVSRSALLDPPRGGEA